MPEKFSIPCILFPKNQFSSYILPSYHQCWTLSQTQGTSTALVKSTPVRKTGVGNFSQKNRYGLHQSEEQILFPNFPKIHSTVMPSSLISYSMQGTALNTGRFLLLKCRPHQSEEQANDLPASRNCPTSQIQCPKTHCTSHTLLPHHSPMTTTDPPPTPEDFSFSVSGHISQKNRNPKLHQRSS